MGGGNTFYFKRFAVTQEGCAMKVGTDGVLLGAWCRIEPWQDKAILDIGTGTGVIALQLAQRTDGFGAFIEAVEIDSAACDVAGRNFEASEWGGRLALHRMSAQEFACQGESGQVRFDHIVSNPPYFVDSLSSPDASRNLARHTAALSYDELMSVCDSLLKADGRISLVLPAGNETERMIAAADAYGFVVSRRTEVHSTPKSGPKRTLLEFLRRQDGVCCPVEPDVLVIGDVVPGGFSAEYRSLTRDFYLYF